MKTLKGRMKTPKSLAKSSPKDGAEVSQCEPSGNTKNAWHSNQLYRWFFTLDSSKIELSQLSHTLREISKKFNFQLEKGDTGYEHFQGVFSLKTKERFATVKNHFCPAIHLEPCKDWWKSIKYTSKDHTKVAGPWNEVSVMIKTIKPDQFYKWQTDLAVIIDTNPDDRKIHWLWESEGNVGKTAFCKWAYVNKGATIIQNGSSKDLAYAIPDSPTCVIVNLPRTSEDRVNYSALESIKDGLFFSPKYESGTKIFDPPHLIVFANFEPLTSAMSKDRWKIIKIENNCKTHGPVAGPKCFFKKKYVDLRIE